MSDETGRGPDSPTAGDGGSEGIAAEIGIEEKVSFLRRADSYPHHPATVEAIETHMAWVFLAGSEAYKMKKEVRYDFLDFSTLEARRRDCREEVRLNRRLAPDVYRGIVALRRTSAGALALEVPDGGGADGKAAEDVDGGTDVDGGADVGEGSGVPGASGREVVEWLVHMRRLPEECMLDVRIRKDDVPPDAVRKVVDRLARFYRSLPRIHITPEEYRDRFRHDVLECRREIGTTADDLAPERIEAVAERLLGFLEAQAPLFDHRVDDGRIVEGHGDLRPEHVCLEAEPVIIDCLEFNRDFRIVDPVDELSFLSVECTRLGAPAVGESFLREYTRRGDGAPPEELIRFYKSFRSFLRAKIAFWHTRDHEVRDHGKWMERTATYVGLAEDLLPGA